MGSLWCGGLQAEVRSTDRSDGSSDVCSLRSGHAIWFVNRFGLAPAPDAYVCFEALSSFRSRFISAFVRQARAALTQSRTASGTNDLVDREVRFFHRRAKYRISPKNPSGDEGELTFRTCAGSGRGQ